MIEAEAGSSAFLISVTMFCALFYSRGNMACNARLLAINYSPPAADVLPAFGASRRCTRIVSWLPTTAL